MFSLVRPNLETNPVEIKMPKRGRPRKNISESTKSKTKQNESSKQLKPDDVTLFNFLSFTNFSYSTDNFLQIIQYPLTATKSGRLCKPPRHLLSGEKVIETKKNSFLIVDNNGLYLFLINKF